MTHHTTLTGHEIFTNLQPEQVDRIRTFSWVKDFQVDQVIYEANSEAAAIFVLLEGRVALRLPSQQEGFDLLIDRIEPGGLFGATRLLGRPRYMLRAQALKPSKVMAIEAQEFKHVLTQDPILGNHIMSRVAEIYFARYVDVMKRLSAIVAQVPLETR